MDRPHLFPVVRLRTDQKMYPYPMRIITSPLALGLVAAAASYAQNQPILGEDTVKVSDHVWAIMGFPNIGIVVGGNATLVIDTGLGPRNGATVAKVAKKLAPKFVSAGLSCAIVRQL